MSSSNSVVKEKKQCFHCGDDCGLSNHKIKDKHFCCLSCKTVFEILNDQDLIEYYSIENKPGNKVESEHLFSDFSFLEMDEIKDQLVHFREGSKSAIDLSIPGIHCTSCIWLLERLPRIHQGVIKVEVNFLKKQAKILFDHEALSLRELAELLERIGYQPNITLVEKDQLKANRKRDRGFIYKLGISGFAFGNIMLLSFPEYFDEGMYLDQEFGPFFGWINLVFGLPVFFYCSAEYYLSAWKGLKAKSLNIDVPIALGIFVLFGRSAFEIISQTGPGYMDSMTGLVFFLLIGRWFQNRTYQALSFEKDYRSYFPLGVTVERDGQEQKILLKHVQEHDRLIIHHGELIPADSLLTQGEALIDYGFVTGESAPVPLDKGALIYAGGRQKGGRITVETTKKFSQSYLMQLWKHEDDKDSNGKPMSSIINRVSEYFTLVVLLIAMASGIYWAFVDPTKMIHAVSSVLIIACPCALALSIPFTYGNGLKLLERVGIYLKDAQYIERMSQIDTIVFDKTGTITSQKLKSVVFEGKALTDQEKGNIRSLSLQSTHPMSQAIGTHLDEFKSAEVLNFREEAGNGIEGNIQQSHIKMGSMKFLSQSGTSLASTVHLEIEGEYRGYFRMGNLYRKGLQALIQKLMRKFKVEVITGDLEGERQNLLDHIGPGIKAQFSMSPVEKRDYIRKLNDEGSKVLMVGDGLNDAGAIKESHVGVSVSDDIYGFLPACDAILESARFVQLDRVLAFSKGAVFAVKGGIAISFAYNLVGMYFAVQGLLSPVVAAILMPLSSVTVVVTSILATNLLARKHKFFSFDKN